MAAIKFTNFYSSTLATPPTGTTEAAFTVTSAVGLPTLGAGDWCYVVVKNASLTREIIKIGTISGTTLTPATGGRGADSSAAYASWLAGDVIELCAVNASLLDLLYDFKNNFYNVANTFKSVFTNTNTAIRTYTFPDQSGTVITEASAHAAASKTTPVDADEIPLLDSAAAFGLKRLTWANLVATVLTAVRAIITPSGVIWLWSGSVASIPSGFFLCNGLNGTPDLRDKFLVGAGSAYAVGAVGGSADAIVVSHTHTATDAGHTHLEKGGQTGGTGGSNVNAVDPGANANTSSATATGTASISVSTTGVSGTNANLPPYYALAYIMKS